MWARIVTIALGIWLMVAPDLFDFNKTISDNGHIIGPLMITFSVVALSECMRNVKMLNLALAAWLLFAPWILHYDNSAAVASDYATGVLALMLTLVKQKRQHWFAGGWYGLLGSAGNSVRNM
jgi:hypothetical protein